MLEKKSKKWTIVVGVLIIGVILSAGCVDDKPAEEATAPSSTQPSTTEASTTEAPTTPSSGGLLSDLLDKAKGSPSATYDLVISGGATPGEMTSKVWSTETKERMDSTFMGMKSTLIIDKEAQVMYDYNPDKNTATKMDFSGADTQKQTQSFSEVMAKYDPKVVGTETIDGKKCTVIEFDVTVADTTMTQTMWVWDAHGFPVKMEMTSSLTPGTTVIEMKNIEFGPIQNSVFELPEGVVITELGEMDFEGMDLEDMSEMPPFPGGE